jgi:hypothetical protein
MPLEKWIFAHGQNVGSRYAILKGHFVLFLEYMTDVGDKGYIGKELF